LQKPTKNSQKQGALKNSNIDLVIDRINRDFRNQLILIAIIGGFFLLLFFSIIWLAIPIILVLAYVAYRLDMSKTKRLNVDPRVLASLGQELQKFNNTENKSNMLEVCGYYKSGDWLISDHLFGFGFFNVNDICWVHLQSTKHSVNFVPTGTSHGIMIYLSSGAVISKDYGYGDSNQTFMINKMAQLQRIAPWAIYGYNQQLKDLWSSNRASFIAAVNQNKQKIRSATNV
jgi:hypothetical protein